LLRKLKDKFQENFSQPAVIDARAQQLRNTGFYKAWSKSI
jgi:hypothetical protein